MAFLGCGGGDVEISTSAQPALSSNGIWENGLETNGIWENGIWENGIWENGVFQNGIWENGIWENGIWENGIWENGIWENGIWENGIWENGIWENGVWEGNLAARDLLRTNAYAGKLLQYIYSCAMPAGVSKVLDPSGANVLLEGAIGLAPAWDGPAGACDETCQRWVSACVLARTNAYGVHVQISMRAPDSAPQSIKDALATTVDERTNWNKREGAYYGNLFQTTPLCNGTVDTTPGCVGTSTISNTPKLYACAGPVSNIPEITKRFCSSQGDNGPITPVGECLAINPSNPSACTSIDDPLAGAMRSCYSSTGATPVEYDEVITVYLKDPISVCGNQVCEPDEAAAQPNACPSDCHPGGWAQSYNANFGVAGLVYYTFDGTSAVSPVGDMIYFGGISNEDVNLGGANLPAAGGSVAIAKLTPDGGHVWSQRLDMGQVSSAMLAATPDGGVVVAVFLSEDRFAKIRKINADGTLGWLAQIGSAGSSANGFVKADAAGNIYVAASARNTQLFGTATFTSDGEDVYVVKLSPTGSEQWARQFAYNNDPVNNTDLINRIDVDPNGAVLLSITYNTSRGSQFIKLDPATGLRDWEDATISGVYWDDPSAWWVTHNGLAGDAAGNVYFSGFFHGAYDFEGDCGAPSSGPANAFYVARYGTDGRCDKVVTVQASCTDPATCRATASGGAIAFDRDGNIVVGGYLDGTGVGHLPPFLDPGLRGATIDFGAGPFDNYRYRDTFFVSYTPDLEFRWAKHVPMVLYGNLRGLAVTSQNKLVVSGTYSGSLTIDGYFLVNTSPQELNVANTYLASIPVAVREPTPPTIANIPNTIVKEATSSAGAEVFYNPPTATDPGNDGVTIACTPRPWSVFPIGTTTVNCTATDPFGYASSTSFQVTVRDRIGPMLHGLPAGGVSVPAAGATTIVTWALPTALDQIDGVRPVTCVPSAGSAFATGETMVTCSAADANGNVSSSKFTVDVVPAYSWSGVLQPVNADGSSIFKQGSTIPVKFKLTGWSAGITDLVATITLVKLSPNPNGSVVEPISTSQADTGNTFRYEGGQYVYNLSTKNLTAGTYRISLDLGDYIQRTVDISLKQ
ncbi:MAG: HYR domain-containing protein [Myxococcota bacterium]|nr:HYR domain-containing protein [Myxococcota bacterium]